MTVATLPLAYHEESGTNGVFFSENDEVPSNNRLVFSGESTGSRKDLTINYRNFL